MTTWIKKSDLTRQERLLLRVVDRWSFACRSMLNVQIIDLWCDLGLPFLQVGRERYFDPPEVLAYFESIEEATGERNIDKLWRETPEELLPRTINLEGGQFWLVPLPATSG